MARASSNGIEIEFDSFGDENHETIVLISGLGVQMTRWPAEFCDLLAGMGYRVVRFDNRDVGLSTSFNGSGTPDFELLAASLLQGKRPEVPYTLFDMVADVDGLLDFLGIDKVHVVGRSLGGMIAQLFASQHAGRTLSLTSIMSSSGNPALPPSKPEAMAAMVSKAPSPSEDREGYLEHGIKFSKVIGSPKYPTAETAMKAQIECDLARSYRPNALARQIAALAVTGDIRPFLHAIDVPTLIIHGDSDLLVPVEAGKDSAKSIRGAELLLVEGMGHDFPAQLHLEFATAIGRLAKRSV